MEFYKERLSALEQKSAGLKNTVRWLSFARLLAFLSVFPCVFYGIPMVPWLGIILSILCISLFLYFIKLHLQYNRKLKHVQALAKINAAELKALNFEYEQFYPGDEFVDTLHSYSYDMDLFGNGSLFQFINRCVTFKGRNLLAQLFSKETLDTENILNRQEAVRELSGMQELLQDFRASGSLGSDNESDLQILEQWIHEPDHYLSRKGIMVLTKLLPSVTIASIILAVFIPFFMGLSIVFFLLQLFIVSTCLSHTSREHAKLNKRTELLRKYQFLVSTVEGKMFSGTLLRGISDILIRGNISASSSIRALVKILSAFDNRMNILAAIFLEGLLLWDLQCMIRLERWKAMQGKYFTQWIDGLALFDTLASLATFTFNYPKLTFPEISENTVMDSKQMGHILIPDNERICNDFQLTHEGEFVLVTGANMAGKSTFLRTVATNMILAMAGAPVCAESFTLRPMRLFSSMRTSDSLNKHESYFYAELRRLKEMLDRLQDGENLFIILDEILKGTNSDDKQRGSRAVFIKVLELKGTGILATHDLNLVTIEKEYPERIKNMCFEIEINRADISFDYKLRDGVTTKMNALLLMQQMGIIKEQADQS